MQSKFVCEEKFQIERMWENVHFVGRIGHRENCRWRKWQKSCMIAVWFLDSTNIYGTCWEDDQKLRKVSKYSYIAVPTLQLLWYEQAGSTNSLLSCRTSKIRKVNISLPWWVPQILIFSFILLFLILLFLKASPFPHFPQMYLGEKPNPHPQPKLMDFVSSGQTNIKQWKEQPDYHQHNHHPQGRLTSTNVGTSLMVQFARGDIF